MDLSDIVLTMPRFSYASSFHLRDPLAALGMGGAFDPAAGDFSGMDGQHVLFLTDVLHQALVRGDEKGTEAAAATAVVAAGAAATVGPLHSGGGGRDRSQSASCVTVTRRAA